MDKMSAIYKLNPNVVTIRGDEAFDKDNNKVNYDNAAVEALVASEAYKDKRAAEYPAFTDYLDGVVKGDQSQIQAYIDACQAIKNKYPKGK